MKYIKVIIMLLSFDNTLTEDANLVKLEYNELKIIK